MTKLHLLVLLDKVDDFQWNMSEFAGSKGCVINQRLNIPPIFMRIDVREEEIEKWQIMGQR